MYDKYLEEMKTRMQPVLDLAETNKKALEELAALQKDSMTDVINASVEQYKALAQCKDPKSALDLQLKFYKSLQAKMTETSEKGVAAITGAKEAFTAVVEQSAKQAVADVEESSKKAVAEVEKVVAEVEEAVKPVAAE